MRGLLARLQAVVLKGPEGLTPDLQVPNNTPPREAPVKYPERARTDTRLSDKQTVTGAIALTCVS